MSELRRSPVAVGDLEAVAELGWLLDVVVDAGDDELVVKPRGRTLLMWAPDAKALVWVTGARPSRPSPAELGSLEARAANVRDAWTDDGRSAERLRRLRLPATSGKWSRHGRALRIGYRSDKFGARGERAYEHEHGPGVNLYGFASPKFNLYLLRGGKLRVTRRGIEG
jgi:hypothetical protein